MEKGNPHFGGDDEGGLEMSRLRHWTRPLLHEQSNYKNEENSLSNVKLNSIKMVEICLIAEENGKYRTIMDFWNELLSNR